MYARQVGDRELTFDFADGLLNNNLLIVDRETDSVWSQLHGKAIIGPMEGEPLTVIPSVQATWTFWKERHPDTRVMVLPDVDGQPYYYRNRPTGQSSPKKPKMEHDLSVLGFGLAIGDEALWVPLEELHGLETPIAMTLGGQSIRLFHDTDAMTAWAEDTDGNLLSGVLAYREGWLDFFPKSRGLR